MSDAQKSCGLIGLGLMGRGMGMSLLRAGFALHVVANRSRAAANELVAQGATEHATPAELARHCGTVVLCLPGVEVADRVLFGETGWASSAVPGSLVIDCSTQTPTAARRFHSELMARQLDYVDSPLTGGPKDAEAAHLQALVSGHAEARRNAMPVLQAMCQRVTLFGSPGAAQQAKLVNNFLAFGALALIAEALTVAQAAGLDRPAMLEAVRHGGGQSRALERMGQHLAGDPSVTSKATLHTVEKDVRYFKEWAAELGCAGPMAGIVHAQFSAMLERGLGDVYTPEYVRQTAQDMGQAL